MRIRELRKEKNLTQQELATALNLTRASICQYELNKQRPSNAVIKSIAMYFNVSIDYLMELSDDRTPPASIQEEAQEHILGVFSAATKEEWGIIAALMKQASNEEKTFYKTICSLNPHELSALKSFTDYIISQRGNK